MFTYEHVLNILNPPATPKNPIFEVQICQDLGITAPVGDEFLDLFNPACVHEQLDICHVIVIVCFLSWVRKM